MELDELKLLREIRDTQREHLAEYRKVAQESLALQKQAVARQEQIAKLYRRVIVVIMLVLSMSIAGQAQETSSNAQVLNLIAELYTHPWEGAENSCSPMCWDFHFTEPMLRIIEMGPPAQNALLAKLDEPALRDQVIILLGGLGDERAVGPIIEAMVGREEIAVTPNAQRINLAAVLALTNITVAEVIWHHGGGIELRKCPQNPKECWTEWWQNNKTTFKVKEIKQSRRYSNYPNYGIYKQQ